MNSILTVQKIIPGKDNIDLFDQLLRKLYPQEEDFVKSKDMMLCEHLLSMIIIYQNNEPVGGCALYFNPFLDYQDENILCIGNYECVDDLEVSSFLLHEATEEAQKLGVNRLIGPINGSQYYNFKFDSDFSRPSFFSEQFQHDYYKNQFESHGFQSLVSYASHINTDLHLDESDFLNKKSQFEAEGVTFRTINLEDYESELREIVVFCNKAFSKLFLYSPISEERFVKFYLPFKNKLDTNLVPIAEKDGKIVAMSFALRNIFTNEKQAIVKTLARLPGDDLKGLGELIAQQVVYNAKKSGYTSLVHALMIDDEAQLETLGKYFGQPYKKYSLYTKKW